MIDIKEYRRRYYQANKIAMLANAKIYNQEHKEQIAAQQRDYQRRNKGRVRLWRAANYERYQKAGRCGRCGRTLDSEIDSSNLTCSICIDSVSENRCMNGGSIL